LLDFLDQAGVTPTLSDERCLTDAERVEAERAATIEALEVQNDDLAGKLEAADRLMRLAVIILIAGASALLIAILVLGWLLLARRRGVSVPSPDVGMPQAFEIKPQRSRPILLIAAIVVAVLLALVLMSTLGSQSDEAAPQPEAADS
jgi:hypothetical protein